MAKIERLRLLGSNELPVYDLGATRRAVATLPVTIERGALAAMVAGGAGFCIALIWWIAG